MNVEQSVGDVVWVLWEDHSIRKATKYWSPTEVVKATRQHPYDGREAQHTFVVTVGKPNYAERAFIKIAKKAGEPFPIKKIQVK